MTETPQTSTDTPSESPADNAAPNLEAEAIIAYLLDHPDFFAEHDELLVSMRIPHQRGDTVSLVERQLMDVARDNDRLFDKTRRLNLALMDATSLEDIVIAVEDSLRQEFQVPFVSLILFSDNAMPVGRWVPVAEAQKAIGGLIGEKTVCGALREHELTFLFGAEQGKEVGSTAIVTLNHLGLHGVLAIGSRDPQHYKSSVGTLFLNYIADVLGRLLPRFTHALRSVR
jgi:uncharacterized protein YigA (DUF484 family)